MKFFFVRVEKLENYRQNKSSSRVFARWLRLFAVGGTKATGDGRIGQWSFVDFLEPLLLIKQR